MMKKKSRIRQIEDFEPIIGAKAVERILKKAQLLKDKHVVHVNSTSYGGGVSELLASLTVLMNSIGIQTGWRVLVGSPDFFGITKKMHNALQGDDIRLTNQKKKIFENVIIENAIRNHLDHDFVIIHDPQPLPLIKHYHKRGPWIWRCHIDLSKPNKELWNYLTSYIKKYDAMILSIKEYRRKLSVPQVCIMPAIDPFAIKNRDLSEKEIDERLDHYDIPTDFPLIVQISRFDRWKDPLGVIKAFKIVRKRVKASLILLGNVATDDPEGEEVYQQLLDHQEERIRIISREDTALVNALQSRAAVVLQKSIREGFGLTVSEAMWKKTPVIGGNVGGIRYQIEDGVNGFLVSSINQAAERIELLLRDEKLRRQMGMMGKRKVQRHFLISRLLENHMDLLNSFETMYRIRK
jgi:trehalose synthase